MDSEGKREKLEGEDEFDDINGDPNVNVQDRPDAQTPEEKGLGLSNQLVEDDGVNKSSSDVNEPVSEVKQNEEILAEENKLADYSESNQSIEQKELNEINQANAELEKEISIDHGMKDNESEEKQQQNTDIIEEQHVSISHNYLAEGLDKSEKTNVPTEENIADLSENKKEFKAEEDASQELGNKIQLDKAAIKHNLEIQSDNEVHDESEKISKQKENERQENQQNQTEFVSEDQAELKKHLDNENIDESSVHETKNTKSHENQIEYENGNQGSVMRGESVSINESENIVNSTAKTFEGKSGQPIKLDNETTNKAPHENLLVEEKKEIAENKPISVTKGKVSKKPANNKKAPAFRKFDNSGSHEEKPLTTTVPEDDRPIGAKGTYNFPNEGEHGIHLANANPMDGTSFKSPNAFDDVPIGNGNRKGGVITMMSEYPEGADPSEIDGTANTNKEEETGPLDKRIKSKIVKTRQNAFEELADLIQKADEKDPIVSEYVGEFIKFIAEGNPAAQEKALLAFKAYVEKVSTPTIDGKNAIKVLIDKAIGPAKPNTKKISNELLCLFFEKLEKTALFEGLNDSIAAKNQKTACAGVQAVVELLVNYGPRKLDFLKPFFGSIEKLAGSTVAPLRNEAMNFYKEALKWMGEAAKPFTSKLKKQQIEELDKFLEEWPKQPMKPIRGEEEQTIAVSKGSGKDIHVNDSGLDPYDIADPVDIFHKFNDHWCEKVLAQAKWLDKKQMLEELVKAASVPRISPTGHVHINAMLKRLMNDSNMNVMLTAIKLYGLLAKGLRKNFAPTIKAAAYLILQKFREKKTQVIDETYKTFDNLFYAISLEDISEDLKEALTDKNAFAKVNLLGLIDRFLERNQQTPEKCEPLFKNMVGTLKGLLGDGDGSVRSSAMATLGKMKMTLGDTVVGAHLNDIDQSKLSKINDKAQKTDALEEEKSASTVNTSVVNPSRSQTTKSQTAKKIEFTSNKTDSAALGGERLSQRAQTSKNFKNSVSSKGNSQPASNKPGDTQEGDVFGPLSAEEAEIKLIELGVADNVIKGLESANWKEKQTSLSSFGQWVNMQTSTTADFPDVVIRFLKAKLKDWKESNLGLNKENFAIISSMCNRKEINLNKRAFYYVSGLLVNNCHDVKFTETVYGITRSFVEQVTPKYVINTLITLTQDSKSTKPNPKTYIEICNILIKLLDELTVRYFPLQETIEYGKFAIGNQNSQCRAAATNIFKALYEQVGPRLNDLINDIPPQTLKGLQAEFEKLTVIKDSESKVKVEFRGEVAAEVQHFAESNPFDTLPRADISREADKIVKILGNSDWKVRKEGLDQLEQLLTSNNNRILPNGLNELVNALKTRLTDPNKALVRGFTNFVGKLTVALGKDIQRYSKTLIHPLVGNLSDKQAQIRQDALACLEKIGAEVGQDVVISAAIPLLVQESPEMRAEIINLALKHVECLSKADIKTNINAILSVLQDRNKEIRIIAEKLLEKCIEVIGTGAFTAAVSDLKPAIQKDLKPIISKYAGDTESINDLDASVNLGKRSDTRTTTKKVTTTTTTTAITHANNTSNPQPPTPVNKQKNQKTQPSTQSSTQDTTVPTNSEIVKPNLKKSTTPTNSTSHNNPSNTLTSNHDQSEKQIPSTPTSKEKSNINSAFIFSPAGQKELRIKEEKKVGWVVDELRDDLIERLKNHLKRNVSPDLLAKMFSYDFRKHLEAIASLKKALVLELSATIELLDLIVRWIFIRMFDNSNTQTLKELIDYISCLVNTLDTEKYTLLPFEAQVLIPALIERLGNINASFKSTISKTIIKAGMIYPPVNLVALLLQGLNSKNPRVRIECLEMMIGMAQLYGTQIFNQKDLKFFGELLTHQDSNIRNSAMNLLAEIGGNTSNDIMHILSDVPSKILDQLQAKIFIQSPTKMVFEEGTSELTEESDQSETPLYLNSLERSRSQNIITRDPSQQNFEGLKLNRVLETQNDDAPKDKPESPKVSNSHLDIQKQTLLEQKFDEEILDRSLNFLMHGNSSEKLDALLLIHDLAISDDDENRKLFRKKADSLLQALLAVLKTLFDRNDSEFSIKFVQYFLNMSHKLSSIKSFLRSVSEANLNSYAEEILTRLLAEDEAKGDNIDNEAVVKVLNATMLRVLENSHPTDILSVLFDLLIKYRKNSSYSKIIVLIVKCILKLTKCLEQILPSIQPDRILIKSHLYLIEFADATEDDIGVKTIKAVLNELVRIYKEKIWDFYSVVESHSIPDSQIQKWIMVILKPLKNIELSLGEKKDNNLTNKISMSPGQPAFTFSTASLFQNTQTENMADVQEIPEIKRIIEDLRRNDNFEKNIQVLYELILQHPGINLGPYFKGHSKTFIDYAMASLERANFQKNYPFANDGITIKQSHTDIKYRLSQQSSNEQFDIAAGQVDENSRNVPTDQVPNLAEHQNKLNTLKLRYGLLKIDNSESYKKTNTIPLQDTSKSINTSTNNFTTTVNSKINTKNSREGDGSRNSSTQEILQKLSEMKAKMNSIVNANKNNTNS